MHRALLDNIDTATALDEALRAFRSSHASASVTSAVLVYSVSSLTSMLWSSLLCNLCEPAVKHVTSRNGHLFNKQGW